MKTKHKHNIFDILNKISNKNITFYDQLDEDGARSLHPLVIMRWLTGTSDARQIYFINELVNPYTFVLHKHKKLLIQLLTISASGKKVKYNWIKCNSRKEASLPASLSVIKRYFGYSKKHALDAIQLLSNNDVLQYARELGEQPDTIKQITKELKARI